MNLSAHAHPSEKLGCPLFCRNAKNKSEAKKMVLHNPWAFRVGYVIFKNKRYEIKEVYKW